MATIPLLGSTRLLLQALVKYLTPVVMKCQTFLCTRVMSCETHNEPTVMLCKLISPILKNKVYITTDIETAASTYKTLQKSSQRKLRTVKFNNFCDSLIHFHWQWQPRENAHLLLVTEDTLSVSFYLKISIIFDYTYKLVKHRRRTLITKTSRKSS
jgi:hypothetical protein